MIIAHPRGEGIFIHGGGFVANMTERVILVLGSTGGLASMALQRLYEHGASLVLHGRDTKGLEDISRRFAAARIRTVTGDITDPNLGERVWQAAQDLPGRPDGFICFVGDPGRLPVTEWTAENFARLFAVNAAGPLLALRHWAVRLKEAGFAGNAVVFSTMQALYPFEGSLPYSMSKAGLGLGVRILAKEFGDPPAIRINAVAPGVNEAGMAMASIARGKYAPYVEQGIIPRYGHPEDIAAAVMFLMQPDLYMTGQVLLFDGGLTLRRDLLHHP